MQCRGSNGSSAAPPRRTAEVTGIAESAIRRAAEWWGTAKTSFLCHARGLEHHTSGVRNVPSAINIVLASGRIGRPGCGYATITGQGNGQGGREHGQKCDQLPGGRDLGNPEHRAHVAGVWGMDPDDLPAPGVDAYEIIRRSDADVMIAGGSEAAITPMGVGGFAAMRALSTRNDDPERASRPFDLDRDGFIMGEGAGVVILEELEKRRIAMKSNGGYHVPESQTPWQEIFRANVEQLSEGMVLKPAVKYQKIAQTKGLPRDNH